MPKFSANLSMLFTEHAFLDRFDAAARRGFKGVEYLGPYDFPAREVAARLKSYGLRQVLFNLPSGDWAKGERGLACLPDRVAEFREGVVKAIEYAHALDCSLLNVLVGIKPAGVSNAEARATLLANLAFAVTDKARFRILLLLLLLLLLLSLSLSLSLS